MSTFRAEVVRVDIVPHGNADRLDIAHVRGWNVVTEKGLFKPGDLAIYIPVEAVLPESLVDKAGIRKYYHKRLRTVKLRGVYSQGLLIPADPNYKEGDDLTDALGITKWVEPIPVDMAGEAVQADPRFYKYTDIENIKNYPDLIKLGTPVILTEKVHGTNARAANIDGTIYVGSHRMCLRETDTSLYWRGANLLQVRSWLKPGEQVFFEIFGSKIQDLAYGKKAGEIGVAAFDFMVDGTYLNYPDFVQRMIKAGFEHAMAPVLPVPPQWDPKMVEKAQGKSIICPSQMREGFVIRPMIETHSQELGGRLILKCVSDEYLTRRDATEAH
jgi:RNA ligase (TIGR02306 family)